MSLQSLRVRNFKAVVDHSLRQAAERISMLLAD